MEPLGMESGEITAEQIIASSQYNSNWSPERSRLNYHENGWTPSDDNIKEWIQVSSGLLRWTRKFGRGRLISQSDLKLAAPGRRSRTSLTHLYAFAARYWDRRTRVGIHYGATSASLWSRTTTQKEHF